MIMIDEKAGEKMCRQPPGLWLRLRRWPIKKSQKRNEKSGLRKKESRVRDYNQARVLLCGLGSFF